MAAGWGKISEEGELSDILRKVALPLMDKKTCIHLAGELAVTSNMMCTGYPGGKRDACTVRKMQILHPSGISRYLKGQKIG